jgi:hypothetical protein
LRPQQWLDSQHAIVGSQVSVDIPEIGVRGAARVLSIEPSPAIKSGSGQVITGTFRHVARNLIDLYVEGENDPIRCTERHPFWSLPRRTWVAASHLQTGERLLNRLGQSTQVVSVNFATAAEPVFNIEVQGRHVYRVTNLGLLVHNASFKPSHLFRKSIGVSDHAAYQLFVTRRAYEHYFDVGDGTGADGIVGKFIVEAKLAGRNNAAYRNSVYNPANPRYHELGKEADILDQARRLLSLNQGFGLRGVRYAISSSDAADHFRSLFRTHFGEDVKSGLLKVYHVPWSR